MARVVITVTDDPIDGSVSFVTDPPMRTLLDRKRKHGIKSLSTAEIYATLAVNHMLQHAKSRIEENRGRITVPGEFQ